MMLKNWQQIWQWMSYPSIHYERGKRMQGGGWYEWMKDIMVLPCLAGSPLIPLRLSLILPMAAYTKWHPQRYKSFFFSLEENQCFYCTELHICPNCSTRVREADIMTRTQNYKRIIDLFAPNLTHWRQRTAIVKNTLSFITNLKIHAICAQKKLVRISPHLSNFLFPYLVSSFSETAIAEQVACNRWESISKYFSQQMAQNTS